MRILALLIAGSLLQACAGGAYDFTSRQNKKGNYELTLTGYPGTSPQDLKNSMRARSRELCGWPYLIRHTREEEHFRAESPHHHALYAEIECGSGG